MLSRFAKLRSSNDELMHLQDNVEASIIEIQNILAPLVSEREVKSFEANIVNEGGVAISDESGQFGTSSDTFVDVTNMRVAIRTSGRPVAVGLMAGNPINIAYIEAVCNTAAALGTTQGLYKISRDDTIIYSTLLEYKESSATGADKSISAPPSTIFFIDTPTAGFHTYKLLAANTQPSINSITRVYNCKMFAYEL